MSYNNIIGVYFINIGEQPIDTDSVWHAHQQCCLTYERDLKNIIGFVFFHIPQAEDN